jgi:hypothetical protein
MMLSPQAARMGTMLRCIGKSSPQRRPFFHSANSSNWSPLSNRKLTLASAASDSGYAVRSLVYQQRCKSTAASSLFIDSDDDDDNIVVAAAAPLPSRLDYAHSGHIAAAQQRAKLLSQTAASAAAAATESWRINLGRGHDNEWLTGPRPADDWFTGVSPTNRACPGTNNNEPCVCLRVVVVPCWTKRLRF